MARVARYHNHDCFLSEGASPAFWYFYGTDSDRTVPSGALRCHRMMQHVAARAEHLAVVHFSAQRTYFSYDTLGEFGPKTAQVEPKSGQV
jgi:hypothetical protein